MPTPKGLRFPSSSGAVVVPSDIQKLAEDVDGLLVPASGGTYSGLVTFTQPPNVPTPVVSTNAATKAYVDQVTVDHLLNMALAQTLFDGGTAFCGADSMWDAMLGRPLADAGSPSAGTPTDTFDGGSP